MLNYIPLYNNNEDFKLRFSHNRLLGAVRLFKMIERIKCPPTGFQDLMEAKCKHFYGSVAVVCTT